MADCKTLLKSKLTTLFTEPTELRGIKAVEYSHVAVLLHLDEH